LVASFSVGVASTQAYSGDVSIVQVRNVLLRDVLESTESSWSRGLVTVLHTVGVIEFPDVISPIRRWVMLL
jgi:hypothetical protein